MLPPPHWCAVLVSLFSLAYAMDMMRARAARTPTRPTNRTVYHPRWFCDWVIECRHVGFVVFVVVVDGDSAQAATQDRRTGGRRHAAATWRSALMAMDATLLHVQRRGLGADVAY